tara:strand:+ start:2195 stop:2743 length:549 start_codon:yes stop_codon:yes gene_type:complete
MIVKAKFLIPLAIVVIFAAACQSTPDEKVSVSGDSSSNIAEDSSISGSSEASIDSSDLDPSAPKPGTQEDLVQNVGDRIFFDLDSAVLSPQSRGILEKQAEWLRLFPDLSLTIEGHCDERGTREYNLALGERRASAVRSYLIALGVEGQRLNTISYGKERPYALGHDEEAWNLNRRSVSVIN